jgi:chaperonin cofactor prefoldin
MSASAILKLQRAGFTEQQVEALAEYYEAGTATKGDIIGLERRLDTVEYKIDTLDRRTGAIEIRLDAVEIRLDAVEIRLDAVEHKVDMLDGKIDTTRSDLERKMDVLHSDLLAKIAEGKAETIKWVVGIGFAQIATILTVLKLFPGVRP